MTNKTIRVVTRWERFKRLTVWHPINTDPAEDDKWSVRVWLPLYNCLVIIGGWIAYVIGSPILSRLFRGWVIDAAAVTFLVIGVVTLVGVVFPGLWRLEALGKVCISFMLTSYAFLILAFPSVNSQNNSFITVILIMATWGVYPRLTRLFVRGIRESKKRKGQPQ